MSILKCKMCGGDFDVATDVNVIECEYCGTKQTVPTVDNEKKVNLFNRANRLRIGGEFDKAAAIYENIIAEFPEEAEAYWGLCLCNYGIEYVDDPATAKKIPTCHRASFESLQKDENFNLALEYADVVAQKIYRDEAREIDRIMSEILAVSKNEKPYDVFICYKETAENGERTIDSVLAQDVYDALTAKGYRVFFARISLEDKLGRQYEPYIFAALNSAKIMLSFGTKYEYFHAVWVKNEWSRFLKLMANDKSKVLIPCYKDMDAYDMPNEFKALQAQDLGKVGAIQDLIRGISKILGLNETVQVASTVSVPTGALTKRGYFFLEDEDFKSAAEYFDKALDENPEDSKAYAGKVLAGLRKKDLAELDDSFVVLYKNKNFERAIRFAADEDKAQLEAIKEKADRKLFVKRLTVGLAKYAKKMEIQKIREKISTLIGIATAEAYDEIALIYEDAYNRKVNRNYFSEHHLVNAKIKANILRLLEDGEEYSLLDIWHSKYLSDKDYPYYKIELCLNAMLQEGCIEVCLSDNTYCIIGSKEKRIENAKRKEFEQACKMMDEAKANGNYQMFFSAADMFAGLKGYQDAVSKAEECKQLGGNLKAIEEAEFARQEAERKAAEEKRLAEEKRIAEERRIAEEAERKQKAAYRAQGVCQHCGSELKGLFTKKCTKCGKPKDY